MTYYKVDNSVTAGELSRIVAELKEILAVPCLIDVLAADVDDVRLQIVPMRSPDAYEIIRCKMHKNPTHVLKTVNGPFWGPLERCD